MPWMQKKITLPAFPRGCHLVTQIIEDQCPELNKVPVGLLHIFIQHTSASLTINENADPTVRIDMESALNLVAPESYDWQHKDEGSDDMPAHVKSSLMGCSLSIPIAGGCMALGRWQGIYLNEHRDSGGPRNLVISISS